ncbi:hypothetical protein [Leucobacter chromiireducens]|uniref:Uncharacterized protein n=1 Tax=Leucobacter chromiireducens subsp. chromiireducens TaxID=660067 RepID=A0ABS1SMW5_9MICO|nr:hypothetical protein [Leucobacter chromiireducens]MBL3689503.1 hypothetical protein [Leucobacter chromiireducens subsp. chromiireducens]
MSTSTSNRTNSAHTREATMRRHPSYRAHLYEEPEQGQHDDEVYEECARRANMRPPTRAEIKRVAAAQAEDRRAAEAPERERRGHWYVEPYLTENISFDHYGPYLTRAEAIAAANEIIKEQWETGGPGDESYRILWHPELDANPHSIKARDLLQQTNYAPDTQEEIALLLRAQIEATFALRDQIAGFAPDSIDDETYDEAAS